MRKNVNDLIKEFNEVDTQFLHGCEELLMTDFTGLSVEDVKNVVEEANYTISMILIEMGTICQKINAYSTSILSNSEKLMGYIGKRVDGDYQILYTAVNGILKSFRDYKKKNANLILDSENELYFDRMEKLLIYDNDAVLSICKGDENFTQESALEMLNRYLGIEEEED